MQIAKRYHTVRHFLDGMARLKEQAEDSSKNKRDCVNLMTVHKAKGLESPVIFVMGLTEGIFPHRRSYTMVEDGPIVLSGIAEERRLAYVAFTRAQQLLFLSSILRYRGTMPSPLASFRRPVSHQLMKMVSSIPTSSSLRRLPKTVKFSRHYADIV